jgi:hypothetical protein
MKVFLASLALVFLHGACNENEGSDTHGTHGNWRAGPKDDGRQERVLPGSREPEAPKDGN